VFTFIAPSDITFSQDLLLFDPVDDVLSLPRLIIDWYAVKESIGSGVAKPWV